MQFKRVKGKIQVLAYRGYDKEKRRAIVKMLGSIDAYNYSMSDGLQDAMTVEEKEELQSYIESLRQSDKDKALQYMTEGLHRSIKQVSDSLATGRHYMTDDISNRLYAAIDELQKAMRRAGFKRPAKPKKAVPADARTAALPLDNAE